MTYNKDGILFEYELVYTNRKTIEIRIEPNGLVKLKLPMGASKKVVSHVFDKKATWIDEKVKFALSHALPRRLYKTGEKVLFLGEKHTLKITRRPTDKGKISFVDQEFILIVPENVTNEFMRNMLIALYKKLLKRVILERIHHFQSSFSVLVNKVTIRDQKTRWGSCSSGRNLSFNYRLLMAPKGVIDYIVIHEMSHLEHMNHSKVFWQKVHEVMPDYKHHETWLKNNGKHLNFDLEVL
jgi:predicted metal-dependent hydrolase